MVELDNTQRRAIESNAKTIIVKGGPGAGKTRLLTERFAYLVEFGRLPLSSIVVFTFSSSSAAQLRRLIEERLQRSYDELWVHAYHSFARIILTEYSSFADVARSFIPVSPFREYLMLKELLRSEQTSLQSNLKGVAYKDGAARELSDFFGLLKQNLIGPDLFRQMAGGLTPQLSDLARIYSGYDERLNKNNQVGIKDVIARAIEVFEREPKLLAQYHAKFSHVLVDEFQEIDPSQLRLLMLLAPEQTSLFVAGDENQRIFRFRGSATGQFSDITSARRGAETFTLEENHRLSSAVQRASKDLIAYNSGTERETAPAALGGELSVARYKDAIEQAYAIARDIKGKVLDSAASSVCSVSYSDFAVLCRSTYGTALPFQEAFSYYGIPYVLYNCTSFYQHPMARLTADFVRLLVNPDDDAVLLRVLSTPAFRLDAVRLRRLSNSGKPSRAVSLYEAIRRALNDANSTLDIPDEETAQALREFISYFEDMHQKAAQMENPSSIICSIMGKLFYKEILHKLDTGAGIRDAHNLRSLYEVVGDIEQVFSGAKGRCSLSDVSEYMEHAFAHFSSQQENDPADETADGVRIMTVHQAKGMGFPFAYLVDMTDEYFPLFRGGSCLLDGKSFDELGQVLKKNAKNVKLSAREFSLFLSPQEQLKEERQLAYVALTRASRSLTICFTEESHFSEPVKPSPFIEEFIGQDPERVTEEDKAGSSREPRLLIRSSLNTQEVESALRTCVHGISAGVGEVEALFRFFEALRLDANFICSESPFKPEPPQAPSLASHRYSATQLTTYLKCPREFFFERILRIAPERPEDFGLGQLVHQVLETFHKEVTKFSGKPASLETTLMKAFEMVWKGTEGEGFREDAFCNQYPTLLQRATIARRAVEILHRYLKSETAQAAGREVVACEKFVEFAVRGYPFGAKMDRIDASAAGNHIIDYKTSASGGAKGALTIKKKFLNVDQKPDYTPEDYQLPLYLLAGKAAGYNPLELSYYWVAQEDSKGMFKKSSLRVCDDEADCLTSDDMEAAEDGIIEVVKRIAAGDFTPNPRSTYECRRCSFDFLCSAEEEDVTEDG